MKFSRWLEDVEQSMTIPKTPSVIKYDPIESPADKQYKDLGKKVFDYVDELSKYQTLGGDELTHTVLKQFGDEILSLPPSMQANMGKDIAALCQAYGKGVVRMGE